MFQWMAKQGSFVNYKAKVKEVVRDFLSEAEIEQ
jgi:hypothetical protein